jgi:SAM-dependent methyltransferase
MDAQGFYDEVVTRLLHNNILDVKMHMLVVCGGAHDWNALQRSGFQHVVISNISPPAKADQFAPFEWAFQDAENLTFPDNAFDFCIVNSGLHHCYSPHRALLEMYRVARKGILLFEPYDNLLTRLSVRLHVGQDYEHNTVISKDCAHGGAANSCIPNYVYRFTEREIVKTINSFAPYGRHHYRFIYRMRIPWNHLRRRKNKVAHLGVRLALPFFKAIEILAPKQSNHFAAVVLKPMLPDELHPWLVWDDGSPKPNLQWLSRRYRQRARAQGR